MKLSISRRTMVARSAAAVVVPGRARRSPRAENGVTDTIIRIGQSAVFSGPAKDFGVDYRAGMQAVLRPRQQGRAASTVARSS